MRLLWTFKEGLGTKSKVKLEKVSCNLTIHINNSKTNEWQVHIRNTIYIYIWRCFFDNQVNHEKDYKFFLYNKVRAIWWTRIIWVKGVAKRRTSKFIWENLTIISLDHFLKIQKTPRKWNSFPLNCYFQKNLVNLISSKICEIEKNFCWSLSNE